jgi:hypothetical protein
VRRELERQGGIVIGEQLYVSVGRTAGRRRRRVLDLLVLDPETGELFVVEVKTGRAVRGRQKDIDRALRRGVGRFSGNATLGKILEYFDRVRETVLKPGYEGLQDTIFARLAAITFPDATPTGRLAVADLVEAVAMAAMAPPRGLQTIVSRP